MGIYLDIELAVQAENKDKVIALFSENDIEFTDLQDGSSHIEGENLALFLLSNREYAEIDAESALLVEHGIQYSAFNYGVYGEVDEQIRNMRIQDGRFIFMTFDLDESKISYTDLQELIDTSKSLVELQSLIEQHRNKEKTLDW